MKTAQKIKLAETHKEKVRLAIDSRSSPTVIESFVEKVFNAFAIASESEHPDDSQNNTKVLRQQFLKRLPLEKHIWKMDFAEFFFDALWKNEVLKFEELRRAMMKKRHCRTTLAVAGIKNPPPGFSILPKGEFPISDRTRLYLLLMKDLETVKPREVVARLAKRKLPEPANLVRVLSELCPQRKKPGRGRPKKINK